MAINRERCRRRGCRRLAQGNPPAAQPGEFTRWDEDLYRTHCAACYPTVSSERRDALATHGRALRAAARIGD